MFNLNIEVKQNFENIEEKSQILKDSLLKVL